MARDIADEAARLRWLAPHIAVPAVRHFEEADGLAWLLTDALPGRTAFQQLTADADAGPAIVDALASFLRTLHAIPAHACPFDSSHPARLALAHRRMEAGLVDEEDFGEAHAGWSARRVWDGMTALLPIAMEGVVTHGDFSLDNILMVDGAVAGCIDVGRAGVADPYQDLAILWDCLGEFDAGLQARLFEAYGVDRPDEARLGFHLALDEFF